ncbi:MAG: thioredoxin-disulfide reductase [bacterium]|nr:thioredoxin-disulfide reductase [bacterium]
MEKKDLVIIGAGPAGLTAGIYAQRAKLNTVILEKYITGGIAVNTDVIENYPGFNEISGFELMQKMEEQARAIGVNIVPEEVQTLEIRDNVKIVKTSKNEYETSAIIIATGTHYKKLNIPGEEKFFGRGISYCAICDGPLYKNKNIAVIGCGNSGIQEGLFLLKFVNHITFVEFLPFIAADKTLQERIKKHTKTKFYLSHKLVSVNGDKGVESITIEGDGEEKNIDVAGVFIFAGLTPNTAFVKDVVKLDNKRYIMTNDNLETSVPGVFAAGDVREKRFRQVVTAAGDGALAAFSAELYIEKNQA